jgi:hypothetical protein
MEGAAGVNAVKIAAIALHTAPSLTRDEARRCVPCNSLLGVEKSLFGSAGFPVHRAGKLPLSLCPEWKKLTKAGTGRRKIPCRREFQEISLRRGDRRAAFDGDCGAAAKAQS